MTAPLSRDLCTDCGISRTSDPSRCGRACQFINPRYAELEIRAHGRPRNPARADEMHFGPHLQMVRARMIAPRPGAQWTGIATRLAERLLETGAVEAVLATAGDPADRWKPRPVIVTRAEEMSQCRGMRMGFSPVLSLLDEVAARGLTRVAVMGVPCQVHALRALEQELGLERLYVIGTPCSDNTSTEKFHQFLSLLADRPGEVTYLEFRPDYRVELRFRDGSSRTIPFIQLPMSQLPPDFIPLTCRSCFDYANALADVTVGYMAGDGEQWIIVRNDRGQEMLDDLRGELQLTPLTTAGRRRTVVRAFLAAITRSAGGLPVRRAPRWMRPLIGWCMTHFGPKGLEFARARVEMKHVEGIVNLRLQRPHRVLRMVPDFAWTLAGAYGLSPQGRERPRTKGVLP